MLKFSAFERAASGSSRLLRSDLIGSSLAQRGSTSRGGAMIWSEMAVRLRAPGQGTDMVHRIVETLRDEISAGSLRGGSRITGEKQLAAILRVSRSTLREALRILVHEGLFVSRWGVGTFVADQLPSIVKGRATDVNVPLPLQWIEPHWILLTDEERT